LLEDTIGSAFDRTVAAHPNHEALVVPFQALRLIYSELAERVDRLARGLINIGLAPATHRHVEPEQQVGQDQFAAGGRAILVNINPAHQTEELRYALAQSGR
jgi:fatty-acyl-CoA synthase